MTTVTNFWAYLVRHWFRQLPVVAPLVRAPLATANAIEVDFSLPGERVVEMLERVARERGYPDILVVDNGPELRGRALDGWADDHGVHLYFIDPFVGKTAPTLFSDPSHPTRDSRISRASTADTARNA